MTGNRSYLTDYEEIDGGFVVFGDNSKGGKITRKGKIRTGKLDFEDVYFVKELKFNLFSVSQMCDKKNSILFTDTECMVLSPDFKLTDESHVLLKVSRKDSMYNVDLKNVMAAISASSFSWKIENEVYACQPPGFEYPDFPVKYKKLKKALYRLYQALPKLSMGELTCLQVKQKEDGILISQDKYVNEILNKFGFSDVKTTSTPMETHKNLLKDEKEKMRMNTLCACARFQVNPKISHLHAVKRIFRYLKGQPKLGLWYPRDSPFDLVAYTDSDYAGASLDRKSIIGGYRFLGCKLISWQCKKQTVVANSTTEAKQTKIHIDNESIIYIVKNPVFHSKTKHIEIRHHFIRDSKEKKLFRMNKDLTPIRV
ncbi:hypothetical protein Tco_1256696 [Tanacetum coccineum]